MVEEVKDGHGGSNRRKKPEPADQGGDETKKDKNAKTKTWSVVVKGLKIEDELETTNSDRNENESEIADSVRMFDLETPNQLEAERKEGQRKRRKHCDNKGVGKCRTSRQADRKG